MKNSVLTGLVIYQSPAGEIGFRGDVTHKTLYASQKQIGEEDVYPSVEEIEGVQQ